MSRRKDMQDAIRKAKEASSLAKRQPGRSAGERDGLVERRGPLPVGSTWGGYRLTEEVYEAWLEVTLVPGDPMSRYRFTARANGQFRAMQACDDLYRAKLKELEGQK